MTLLGNSIKSITEQIKVFIGYLNKTNFSLPHNHTIQLKGYAFIVFNDKQLSLMTSLEEFTSRSNSKISKTSAICLSINNNLAFN
jgi:hypothetical protein